MHKLIHYSPTLISVFFLSTDQLLKYLARTHQTFSYYLGTKWLGWEYFANTGVAFSIPLPSLITTLITLAIIVILLIAWRRNRNKQKLFHFGIALIIFGALSNFIDRLAFGFTIDYLRILTGVINAADMMIVAGALLLVLQQRAMRPKMESQNHVDSDQ